MDVPEFQPDAKESEDRDRPLDGPDPDADSYGEDYESGTFGDDEEEDERFSAAYENVVYRDSTDDGMDGSVFDFDSHDEDYLQQVSRPIAIRLAFVERLSLVWRLLAVTWASSKAAEKPDALDPEIV